MFVIAAAMIIVAVCLGYWWVGILASVSINCWYYHEFYPLISIKRAEKIMKSGRVGQVKGKDIPCPAFFLRIMAGKNRGLRRHDQTYRWFLTTTKPFENKDIKIIKIEGQDCWFFMQDCYSQSYVEEAKRTKKAREKQRAKQKTATS
jgi:hypothetical protein